ncbi:MAG: TenA family protein [Roseovarius sp.]|nr:TenA family protein [Roseovarius sp.]
MRDTDAMPTRYGDTFSAWRAAAGADWTAYTRHRFVADLAAGSLPRAAFLHYLVQDYIFLIHFSRAWALAVTKADTIDEMRLCAATMQALIDEEMRLHISTCAEAGIDEATLARAEEAPANLAYTRYVLDAGHAGDFLDLLAALAPCVLGYGEIGHRLIAQTGETPYRDWIETYGGAEYQDLCTAVGSLIDGAVSRRLGEVPQSSPRWPALCRRFGMATKLEIGFWDMGLSAA